MHPRVPLAWPVGDQAETGSFRVYYIKHERKNAKINEAARVYKNDQKYLKNNRILLLGKKNMIISMKNKVDEMTTNNKIKRELVN